MRTLIQDKQWIADNLPPTPGVYQIFDSTNQLIYVGMAKNLKRRLFQYRNAKRIKKHRKMKELVRVGARLEIIRTQTESEAAQLEVSLIQTHRPHYNVEAKYFFLYPSLYIRTLEKPNSLGLQYLSHQILEMNYSVKEDDFLDQKRFGCFRSREFTKDALRSFKALLGLLGHLEKPNRMQPRYSIGFSVRSLPSHCEWPNQLEAFLNGSSMNFLTELSIALLESATACDNAIETQEQLRKLRRFYHLEARPLFKLRTKFAHPGPIKQSERDPLWRKVRYEASDSTSL